MKWFSSPKVRLALIVNGLYFASFYTPAPPHARPYSSRPQFFAHRENRRADRLAAKAPPAYAPISPANGPTRAETHYWRERDQLDVYLTNELTLIRRLGHTLRLSPTFSAKILAHEPPRSVLLHFVAYSQQQVYDKDSPFVITADDAELWRSGRSANPTHSASYDGDQVIEFFGQEIPFDIFFRVTNASNVVIQLGDDRVELTPDQVEALRDMCRRLPQ